MLLSFERKLLAHFILQPKERRVEIFAEAVRDHKTSGPLIRAYRAVEAVL